MPALNEAHAISCALLLQAVLIFLSLNQFKNENVSTKTFEHAIDRPEKIRLIDQSRVPLCFTKRRAQALPCSIVRIKVDELKAVQLSFSKQKSTGLSHE